VNKRSPTASAKEIAAELRALADPEQAARSRRFFKTGPGEYGEGDVFLGIRVPVIRRCARARAGAPLGEILKLLSSPFHEIRHLALVMLVAAYRAAESAVSRGEIYRAYLKSTDFVNNWDLVDCSAEHIVGAHLWDRDRAPLAKLAASTGLWERRIAVMATFHFIKRRDYSETLALARNLLDDGEDLIHKAVGWMLREIGNRDPRAELGFLEAHHREMPRTMLRTAIEKFPEPQRRAWLRKRHDRGGRR